jgi:hypothetical protein
MRSSDKQRFAKLYTSQNKNLSEEEKKKTIVYPSDKLSHIFLNVSFQTLLKYLKHLIS